MEKPPYPPKPAQVIPTARQQPAPKPAPTGLPAAHPFTRQSPARDRAQPWRYGLGMLLWLVPNLMVSLALPPRLAAPLTTALFLALIFACLGYLMGAIGWAVAGQRQSRRQGLRTVGIIGAGIGASAGLMGAGTTPHATAGTINFIPVVWLWLAGHCLPRHLDFAETALWSYLLYLGLMLLHQCAVSVGLLQGWPTVSPASPCHPPVDVILVLGIVGGFIIRVRAQGPTLAPSRPEKR